MGRLTNKNDAYNQRYRKLGANHYRLSWVVDYHYEGDRLRHPRGFTRDTDLKGAVRFAKKHGLLSPETADMVQQESAGGIWQKAPQAVA